MDKGTNNWGRRAWVFLIAGVLLVVGCGSQKRYTIMLARYNQGDQQLQSREFADRAREVLGSKDVWTAKDGDGVSVNYGYFSTDRAGSEARRELDRVKKLREELAPGPYQFFAVSRIPEPDPAAPPNWNLINRPCEYSLEIAAYFDVPETDYYNRKADALQHVRVLRQEGEQAYLVHGRFESRIYVGCLSKADVTITNARGRQVVGESSLIEELRKIYEFRQENGQRLYNIIYDAQGTRVRIPQQPVLEDAAVLRDNIPY